MFHQTYFSLVSEYMFGPKRDENLCNETGLFLECNILNSILQTCLKRTGPAHGEPGSAPRVLLPGQAALRREAL